MKRFVAAIAAMSAAAMACAAGAPGFDGSPGATDPSEGGASLLDGTTAAAADTGPDGVAADAAPEDATDDVAPDTDLNDSGEDGSPDGGRNRTTDSGVDAEASDAAIVSPALGSCDSAQWVATASVSAANNPPAFAVDGLEPTRWSTGVDQAVGQYFQIDFGGLVMVNQVTLDDSFTPTEAEDYPRGVEILGSTDGINFGTTLASEAYATDPGAIVTMSFAAGTTRAIRLQLTTGVSSEWWSIHELRLGCQSLQSDGGTDAASPDPPSCAATAAASAGWTANTGISQGSWVGSASSTGPNDTIQGAFDESSTTRWSSGQAQAGGEWFQVDLGSATSISGVALYLLDGNVTDYPSSYALQLSTDNLTFTTAATGLGAAATAICVPPQSARYVKVTQTGTGDPSWWSIYELNVFP